MQQDLTRGSVTGAMLRFAAPMIAGNLLQQLYNIVDTLVVGRVLGSDALAAVGSSFTLMSFLTSILLGLCMGSGAVFSIRCGQKDDEGLRRGVFASFVLILAITVALNVLIFRLLDPILLFMRVDPAEHALVYGYMRRYLWTVFWGLGFTFLYNFCACLLRALGNSLAPFLCLTGAALVNIALDLWFLLGLRKGVAAAAAATVIAQAISALTLLVYTLHTFPHLLPRRGERPTIAAMGEIARHSILTCVQQSVMNFGILLVQGVVDSFGPAVMAAFAAAVKVDAFAYMPVQDFGNAVSTAIAQNYGAGQRERIRRTIRSGAAVSMGFAAVVSALVFVFARPLMMLFLQEGETAIAEIGAAYLRIEGAFYCGIALLFLLYGLYRAVERPGMSVVLTVISLGTRVLLAYTVPSIPAIGVRGIWWAIPIGWFLADIVGVVYFLKKKDTLLPK